MNSFQNCVIEFLNHSPFRSYQFLRTHIVKAERLLVNDERGMQVRRTTIRACGSRNREPLYEGSFQNIGLLREEGIQQVGLL